MTDTAIHREGWQVWSTHEDHRDSFSSMARAWHWAAWGPRGYESGCEVESGEAVNRAIAARVLLGTEGRFKGASA